MLVIQPASRGAGRCFSCLLGFPEQPAPSHVFGRATAKGHHPPSPIRASGSGSGRGSGRGAGARARPRRLERGGAAVALGNLHSELGQRPDPRGWNCHWPHHHSRQNSRHAYPQVYHNHRPKAKSQKPKPKLPKHTRHTKGKRQVAQVHTQQARGVESSPSSSTITRGFRKNHELARFSSFPSAPTLEINGDSM